MDWYLDAGEPGTVRDLRRQLGDYLRRHSTEPDAVWDAELVAHELVANAVEHASGPVWVSVVGTAPGHADHAGHRYHRPVP